jgi:hypothetical protein
MFFVLLIASFSSARNRDVGEMCFDSAAGDAKLLLEQTQLHCCDAGQSQLHDSCPQFLQQVSSSAAVCAFECRSHIICSETLMLRLLVLFLVCLQTFQIYLGYMLVSHCTALAEAMYRSCVLLIQPVAAVGLPVVQSVRRHGRAAVLGCGGHDYGVLPHFKTCRR